jgi:3-isopropylmalate dehydratase small subunit
VTFAVGSPDTSAEEVASAARTEARAGTLRGRVWIIDQDNIDTDMIFHNRHLAITDINEMGQFAFGNLEGWEHFAAEARPGDIVITGSNFGCGSSRQQAVDCFKALGVQLLVAKSYGAIYERNAINAGLPVLVADAVSAGLKNGDEIEVELSTGTIRWSGGELAGTPFSTVQMEIYQRGGLLAAG